MKYFLFALLFCLSACQSDNANSNSTQENTNPQKEETQQLTNGLVQTGSFLSQFSKDTGAQLIDVRTPQEFEQGHLEGALNLNYHGDNFDAELSSLNKENPVYVYCQSGGRSGKTYHKLKQLGFQKIYDMEGGYLAWNKLEKE